MNALFYTKLLIQQPPPPDSRWEKFSSWFLANWFTAVIIVIGIVLFWMLATSIWNHVKSIGVVGTIVLIVSTALLIMFAMWIINLIIPAAVGFGPRLWNRTMSAAGNQPDLTMPGDQLPTQSTPPDQGGGRDFPLGRYLISWEQGDKCSTLRDGPSQDATILGCVPTGTEVRVIFEPAPSNCVDNVCFRVQIDSAAGLPGGWIHAATLGQYLSP